MRFQMRYKIQEFTYNEETGVSTMLAASPYGMLRSEIICHESDKDVQNQWDAYRFCEYKIAVEFYRLQTLKLLSRFQGALDVFHYMLQNVPEQQTLLKKVQKQVNGFRAEWLKMRTKYYNLKDGYKEYCDTWLDNRRKLREKINKSREA